MAQQLWTPQNTASTKELWTPKPIVQPPVPQEARLLFENLYEKFLDATKRAHDPALPLDAQTQARRESRLLSAQLNAQADLFTQYFLWIVPKEFERTRLVYKQTQIKLLLKIRELEAAGLPIRLLVLKARQMGMSTLIASWIFTQTIFRHNSRSVVMADDREHGSIIFEMYRIFYDALPEGLRPPQGVGSRQGRKLVFDILNSFIQVFVSGESQKDDSGRTGRSATLRYLHLSEFDYYANPEATLNSLAQTVPDRRNTAVFIETTARGYGSSFHTLWEETLAGKRDYAWLFLGWHEDADYSMDFPREEAKAAFEKELGQTDSEEYGNEWLIRETHGLTLEQLNWRRYVIRNKFFGKGGKDAFTREYPATAEEAFRGASYKYISRTYIDFHMKRVKPPLFVGNLIENEKIPGKLELKASPDGYLRIWEDRTPYAEYIVGGDTAEGIASRDFNVGYVGKRRAFGKPLPVARIMGSDFMPLDVDTFAELMVLVGRYYNDGWLIPENNYSPLLVDKIVDKLNYRNLIYERQIRTHGLRFAEGSLRIGWRSTYGSRKYLFELLREYFEHDVDENVIRDVDLIREAMELEADERGRVSAPLKGVQRNFGTDFYKYCDDIPIAWGSVLLGDAVLGTAKSAEERMEDELERGWAKLVGPGYMQPFPISKDTNSLYPNYEELGV